jgi:citrate synthase
MSDHDDDDMSPEEVEAIVRAALGELLNIAAGVADLQATDQAADEIIAVCDLVAEYYQIERMQAHTIEHEDGSYTTRFEPVVGGETLPVSTNTPTVIPGHIKTQGRPKFRVSDSRKPPEDTTQ